MQNDTLGKYTWSFGISVMITSLFSALLVVVKESNQDTVLAWMKSMGHHWVTHGILNIIVFLAIGFALANLDRASEAHNTKKVIVGLVSSLACSAAIIAGFFLLE
ncbi:hypothetical protein [uncultured Pseudodesulfovibrio sp.]|uniref:hypothetical protein n=1 Tax=uncultured Pseudodesulfovibrio sp. TaxID=2035858 RepID=UPI0029C98DD7|nr:hypothetical protein [uncultured Pseudodesulfovibrio sp.]